MLLNGYENTSSYSSLVVFPLLFSILERRDLMRN